jgi:histidine ammonia-lyase
MQAFESVQPSRSLCLASRRVLGLDGASLSVEDVLEVGCGARAVVLGDVAARAVREALELRDVRLASEGTGAVHEFVRASVASVDRDRPLDGDIDAVVGLVRSGAVTRAARLDGRPS